jgi:hypothetical protein
MKEKTNVALVVVVALIVGAAGFFVGMHFAARRVAGPMGNRMGMTNSRMGMMRGRGFAGSQGGPGGMMGAAGEITAVNGNTVTLKAANGTTSTVTLSGNAVVDMLTKGTTSNLKVGENILVNGGGFWNSAETVIVQP